MSRARVLLSTGSLYVLDLSQCFSLAAEAGFDGVEVMCDGRWSTRDPGYLRALSEHFAQPILVLHTPFSRSVPGWQGGEDERARIRHTLALAETVGAESIVVHLPQKPRRVHAEAFGRRVYLPFRRRTSRYEGVRRWIVEELPEVQKGTSVQVALENMPAKRFRGEPENATYWNTITEWSQVHTALTLDTTHWGTFGVDPLEAYLAAAGGVKHVHLSNFDGKEHRLPQSGRLELDRFLHRLEEDGFSGTVSLELDPEVLNFEDPAALRRTLKESLAFCRRHLKQLPYTPDERFSLL